ncbi:sugar-binding domain-containing protein [Kribbella sp. NPDC051952]|uniref:sugar-binding domain-containing protein n=1 Tax=Kribbella sp. NPDC051952 TaxID=3154851 RepID=UPI00341B71A9
MRMLLRPAITLLAAVPLVLTLSTPAMSQPPPAPSAARTSAAPAIAPAVVSGTPRTVRGKVLDSAGRAVAGASVHAARTDRYAVSSADGTFSLTEVPSGSPSVIAAKEGYSFTSVVTPDSGVATMRLARQNKPPRAEYPRPDADRRPFGARSWLSLNGTWSFDFDPQGTGTPGSPLGKAIQVPFSYQSLAAFGEQDLATDDVYRGAFAAYTGAVWYRRSFTVPASFAGQGTRLRIGATNWGSAVWLDGQQVQPFTETGDSELRIDLGKLAPGSTHTLAVKVVAPVVDQAQERLIGRRDRFTNSGGIWQSVWIEPVSEATISEVGLNPVVTFSGTSRTPSTAAVDVDVPVAGAADRATVVVTDPSGHRVATGQAPVVDGHARLRLPIAKPKLWDIGKPNLYQADVTVSSAGAHRDGVRATFGLRSIERRAAPGSNGDYQYIWLNNQPIYLRGTLDQGYNPWGIHTPTGEVTGADLVTGTAANPGRGSVLYDLRAVQKLGLNMVRSHVKLFEPSYYHWADKIGLLVWHEMPNFGRAAYGEGAKGYFETALRSSLARDRNHPSIVIWNLFNEGWGVAGGPSPLMPAAIPYIKDLVALTHQQFPGVLVDDNSACCENGHTGATDINDIHAGYGGYDELAPYVKTFSDELVPGSKRNFDEGVQAGQPWLMSEMAFNTGEQLTNMSLVRALPKSAGYSGVQVADQEDEIVSPFSYDRQDRGTLFKDHNGRLVGSELVHGDDMVAIVRDSRASITPGDEISLPVKLSHFSDLDLRKATLRWKVAGSNREGKWVDPLIGGSKVVAPLQYQVTDAGTVQVRVPENLRTGYVWVWLEAGGKTVAENLLSFDDGRPEDGAFDPTKPVAQSWSGGSKVDVAGGSQQILGVGRGWFEYDATVPRSGGTLLLEASSNEAPGVTDGIRPTGARKFPTKLTVSVDGRAVRSEVLPDDPWDPLGIAARAHGRYGRGDANHYGYQVAIPVPAGKDKVRIRLSSDGGGLQVFGLHAGVQGAPPRVVAGKVSTVVPKPRATVTDRPGVSLAPAALDANNAGVAVVSVVNDTTRTVRDVRAKLDLPAGWTATPIGPATVANLAPAAYTHVAFQVQAPEDVVPGIVAEAVGTALWTDNGVRKAVQARGVQEVRFRPEAFPVVGVEDEFDTDTSGDYVTFEPSSGEIKPQLSFGGGLLRATAEPAYYSYVTHKSGPLSPKAVVAISPENFVGHSPVMDALFIGLVKDARNYIAAWTGENGTGGIDVVVDGRLQGSCCAAGPPIVKGGKWAFVVDGNNITTWTDAGQGWTRVLTTSTLGAVDLTAPGVVQQYKYAVGFRGQSGEQAIRSLTGRSFPAK